MRPQYASRLLSRRAFVCQRNRYVATRWASDAATSKNKDTVSQPVPKPDPSESPGPVKGDSEMITQQSPPDAMVDHQPDYHAPIDHATS